MFEFDGILLNILLLSLLSLLLLLLLLLPLSSLLVLLSILSLLYYHHHYHYQTMFTPTMFSRRRALQALRSVRCRTYKHMCIYIYI